MAVGNRDWQTLQCLEDEVAHDSPVIHMHSSAKRVEYSSYSDVHFLL